MEVLIVVLVLLGALIFLLPRRADPGKKISPAGIFLLFAFFLLLVVYLFNR